MSTLQVQTPPKAEPVSLVMLKNSLRVTISDDDTLLGVYLQGARETVESDSGRSLVNKLYRQSHDHFPSLHDPFYSGSGYTYQAPVYARGHRYDERQQIKLLRCPLVNVQKIVYIGTDAAAHTLLPIPAPFVLGGEYTIGDQFTDGTYLQEVTAATESEEGGASVAGSSLPSWNATPGGTTATGDLTVTNRGVATLGDFIEDADSESPRIYPAYGTFWPMTLRVPNAVQVFFTAGYGDDGAAAPANLKVAVMMAAGVSYKQREAVTDEQLHQLDWYERLIWSHRVLDYSPTK